MLRGHEEEKREKNENDKHDRRKRKFLKVDKEGIKNERKRSKTEAEDIRRYFRTEDKH